MSTTPLVISLPEPLKAYIERQVSMGSFGTPSEYIRDLIRQDKERHGARLEAELLDALGSTTLAIDSKVLADRSLVATLREKLGPATER